MAHEYKFSLLLANQYTGGPLAWNDNVLISANGALLNEVDVTRDCARAFKIAKSEVISIAISVCRLDSFFKRKVTLYNLSLVESSSR